MDSNTTINISSIKKAIEKCCLSKEVCQSCAGKDCLVGFAKIVSSYAEEKKTLAIPGGISLIPKEDFKAYYPDDLAKTLAIINLECKNCMDNHDDNCVINIMRSSLEVALMGQNVKFTGSPLAYIMSLNGINSELGSKVMMYYSQFKENSD